MRVPPVGPLPGAASTRRAAASGFSRASEETQTAHSAQSARAPSSVAGIEALLALQAEGFDPDRRGRQLRRANLALDKLDAIKRALVLGGMGEARAGLEGLAGDLELTGEAGLDSILLEIETRRAVELAKLERR
ncbi:MAG: flagellar assembly protein FliX [Caulobacterales bacterium]|jgi:hypothetical protein